MTSVYAGISIFNKQHIDWEKLSCVVFKEITKNNEIVDGIFKTKQNKHKHEKLESETRRVLNKTHALH